MPVIATIWQTTVTGSVDKYIDYIISLTQISAPVSICTLSQYLASYFPVLGFPLVCVLTSVITVCILLIGTFLNHSSFYSIIMKSHL